MSSQFWFAPLILALTTVSFYTTASPSAAPAAAQGSAAPRSVVILHPSNGTKAMDLSQLAQIYKGVEGSLSVTEELLAWLRGEESLSGEDRRAIQESNGAGRPGRSTSSTIAATSSAATVSSTYSSAATSSGSSPWPSKQLRMVAISVASAWAPSKSPSRRRARALSTRSTQTVGESSSACSCQAACQIAAARVVGRYLVAHGMPSLANREPESSDYTIAAGFDPAKEQLRGSATAAPY